MKTVAMPAVHRKSGAVRCGRCGGLMVQEYIAELSEECWKCVVCGERVDPLILAHRWEGTGTTESSELKPSTVQ